MRRVIKLQSIDSTHLYALRLVERPAFSIDDRGVVIVADEQTNGIGRCKRRWESSRGNLFASIIMKMPTGFDLGQLSLTVACAVRESIAHYIPMPNLSHLVLHWPNDVYFRGKKISGLLFAVSNDFLIISIGINVNASPRNVERPTTSIREINQSSTELHVGELLCILLENIDEWISRLREVGFSGIKSYWLQNIDDINCNVTVKNGNSILSGIFSSISDSGKAILKVNDNENECVLISSGDLFLNQDKIGYSRE